MKGNLLNPIEEVGQVQVDGKAIGDAEIAILEQEEPIREPIIGYGPFVMNTKAEIHLAYMDFQHGKMGTLGKVEGAE